jgi:hypothetical protein
MFEVNLIFASGGMSVARSRTFWRCTAIGPIPVWIVRFGPAPCRTTRWRPSGSSSSPNRATKPSASAFIATISMRRAPSRAISVNGSVIEPGW